MIYTRQLHINCAEISLLQSGIILLRYKQGYDVGLSDVKEVEIILIDLSNGNDIYCLMDTSGRFNSYSNDAQKYLSKEAKIVRENTIKASAVVIDNLPNRILAQFFSNFFRPRFAMKILSNQEDGLKWLESEKDKNSKNLRAAGF